MKMRPPTQSDYPDILRAAGERIYGPRWHSALARALAPYNPSAGRGLHTTNMWNMVHNQMLVPDWVIPAVVDVARKHASRAAETRKIIETMCGEPTTK